MLFVLVLCLLASDIAAAQPFGEAESPNHVGQGADSYRLRAVRFSGDPVFEPGILERAWSRRPAYEPDAIGVSLAQLRSLYLSHGYFDARVVIGDVTFDGRDATVTVHVRSGPKRQVRQVRIDGLGSGSTPTIVSPAGELPFAALCRCLLDAQRMAEAHGRLDFAVNLEIGETIGAAAGAAPSEVDVTAQVQMGSPYSVGRISFSGHRTINDSTLRRMIGLNERDRFDVGKLRRSLAGLSRAGRFEPLSPDAIEIRKDPNILAADLTIALEERPRGQWSISNPVAPLTGALQATVSSRLPAWGQGILEASTYYVTVGAIAPWNPLVRFLPIASKRSPWSWIALDRPWLPGQGPLSGFSLSPMLSARTMLARYGLTHASRGARAVLASGDPGVTLVIPVSMPTPGADDGESRDARFLLCEPPQPRLRWLRAGAAYIADLALGALLP